jgi:hypothetical protein
MLLASRSGKTIFHRNAGGVKRSGEVTDIKGIFALADDGFVCARLQIGFKGLRLRVIVEKLWKNLGCSV